jgi:hypothetical protein
MSKAKTASKNNPTTREKAVEIFFNNKKVKPVKFIGNGRIYMAAAYEDGSMVYAEGANEEPLDWNSVRP